MTVPCRIPMFHNRRTVVPKGVLMRSYDVPTHLTLPTHNGIYDCSTATIFRYCAPTPHPGSGDPRIAGKRVLNPSLRTEMFVG
jgi:hypothetical protein